MATTVHMQPPPARAAMDRSPSFDQTRSRSTPPFASNSSSRSSSPAIRPASYAQAAHGGHMPSTSSASHSRTSSNASTSSPYAQPFAQNYFPQQPLYSLPHSQSWSTTALPASSFYQHQMMQPYNGQQLYHPGFQQSQADFAAWANAYQHMVAASMAASANANAGMGHGEYGGMGVPQPEFGGERRRTNSGPSSQTHKSGGGGGSGAFEPYNPPHQLQVPSPTTSNQPFHPYKRAPQPQNTGRSARENIPPSTGSMSRSASTPVFPSAGTHTPTSSISSRDGGHHLRHSSVDSSTSSVPIGRPPPVVPRRESSQTDQRLKTSSPVPSAKSTTTTSTIRAVNSSQQSQPLHTGPIANNATNTPQVINAPRPSPLSQTSLADSPEPEKVKNGLKSRLKKALEKDQAAMRKGSTAPQVVPVQQPTFASPSLNSSHSVTPPTTPPQASDFTAPSAPFSVAHPAAMGSDISIAETERTATGAADENKGKGKRSLFRMRNMSTDNISLSSTVSSASMMIRKMGSIGKLARRNSLMGISKIFKDRPKDEDAALPERDAKDKKDKKKSKKSKGKGEAAPISVTHATAEYDRDVTPDITEEEDRALAGLSPAAKLARQHTLRSKAAAAEKEAQKRLSQGSTSGEPTWDNNTTTRQAGQLPSISSITEGEEGPFDQVQGHGTGKIVRIASRNAPTVVHAVAVAEHEYDSEEDSSDGETVEDVTLQIGRTRLSDGSNADREFREAWGNAWIDKNAVPKKGILKNALSTEDLEATAQRQRASSAADSTMPALRGPMSSPPTDPDKMDGLDHAHVEQQHHSSSPQTMSPESGTPTSTVADSSFANTFTSFDSITAPPSDLHSNYPYQNPSHNTSAPTLSFFGSSKPLTPRALTAPTPVKRRILWAPECAVYSTYDAGTYDRRSEVATCNRLTPELALAIKQELNAFKLEMPVHPASRIHTHYFA